MSLDIKYIKDTEGNNYFPVVHEKGVVDDNGTTLESKLQSKQDAISDIETIRSGARAGATAVQPATTLAGYGITDGYTKTEGQTLENTVGNRLDDQDAAIALLNGSEVIVVADHTQVASPDSQKIYREQGSTSYTDWMYQDSTWKEIATYNFPGIDDEPTAGSNNLVKSGGVFENLTELSGILNGEKAIAYYTSQYLSGVNYIANPLINGKEYKLTVHQIANSWYRFGFAKDNSGTDAYYIHVKNVIGDYEYTFNAPDPTVYPYMVIQKPNNDSYIEISYTTTGLTDTVDELQNDVNTNSGNISTLTGNVSTLTGNVSTLTGNVSTLTGNVSDLSAQTSEIDIELNGIDEQVYYTSAYLALSYIENPLSNGVEYKLFIHQTQATYMRLGFAKDDSGTDVYYIHEKNVIDDYEYTFNAPDPTVYPFMALQKPNPDSTFEIRRRVYGIKDDIVALNNLKENTYIKVVDNYEAHLQSGSYKTAYIPCPMFSGVTYKVSLKGIGHSRIPSSVVAHKSASNTEVGRISITGSNFLSGDYVEFTPSSDAGYLLISFVSTYTEPSGASMILDVQYGEKTAVSAIDIKPLNGRKFIMLGDSITQLPRTGNLHGGVGIVEWFSHLSGAEVIRGAVGGRRLTRTGEKVTTANEITEYNIAVSFFDVIGLAEALASGDFSLQRAAYQWLVDNNYSPDAQMINEVDVLDALDMSTVDAITIFAGTNDWHNNVALQTIKDAIDSIVETLLTAYPKLTIYFFTPIVRYESNNLSNWSDTWQNTAGLTIPQYVDAIMEQAKINCVPVCDLYHGMGWTRYNVTQYIPIGDGTHPHNGFGELAAKMFGFVNSNWPKVYRTIQAD